MKTKPKYKVFLFITFTLFFATNCIKQDITIPGKTTAVFNEDKTYGTVTDIDGNTYNTIIIGTQTWMAENLRTTHFQNGNAIPEVTANNKWCNLNVSACCTYNNISNSDTIATFGRLYNWYAVVDPQKIAPAGWHIPSYEEWMTLIQYESMGTQISYSGGLKEAGIFHWDDPNYGASNNSGFTALPGGSRNTSGIPIGIRENGYWWSAYEASSTNGMACSMFTTSIALLFKNNLKYIGCSVRCVKD